MITIKLEIASNGIVKKISDNNYNGAGSELNRTTVYETEDDANFNNTAKFLYELCDDLGVDLGNKFSQNVLSFDQSWGSHYEPSHEEIKREIKTLNTELRNLKELQKLSEEINTIT